MLPSARVLKSSRCRQSTTCCAGSSCKQGFQFAPVSRIEQYKHSTKTLASALLPSLIHLVTAGQLHAEPSSASSAAAADVTAAVAAGTYVPGPVEIGWEIWFGTAVGVIPFIIASVEFGKRILIQRRCEVCEGSGLVKKGRYLRKCSQCGGMLPWLGWSYFFFSSPGNGGPLLQPKGQTSVFYTVPPRISNNSQGSSEGEDQSSSGGRTSAGETAGTAAEQSRSQDGPGPVQQLTNGRQEHQQQ